MNYKKIISVILIVIVIVYVFSILKKDTDREKYTRNISQESYVYETEVDGPQDCSQEEEYDIKRKVCFFECDDEAECVEIQKSIDDELATWSDELEQDTNPIQEKNIDTGDMSLLAEYKVNTGEYIQIIKGKDDILYTNMWRDIADLSPDSISDKFIDTYQVFDEDQNGRWRVAINLAGYNNSTLKERKATIIHELAHIISLNTTQIDDAVSTCSTLSLDEGCAIQDSYINTFANMFWKNKSQKFDKKKFVTEYASTNEVEDIAESFAFFVLEKEGGLDTRGQKIDFFNQFGELIQIRSDMRQVLGKDIIRARKGR
jgi:hypothetical protein